MNSTEAGSRPGPRRPAARRSRDARNGLLRAAETFVRQFRDENPAAGSPAGRLRQVRRQIGSEGTYEQTTAELEWACRVAWRNSSRCIGRAYWRALQVRDRRHVWAGDDVAGEAVTHLKEATNGGRIRPLITVLAPDAPGRPGPRILSPQLVRYAGYQAGDGTVTGDPLNTGITRLALRLGWPGGSPRGRFDILPLVVRQPGCAPAWYELPPDVVLEVPLSHPGFGWFAELGLRWHAVPVISDMYLRAGGITYPRRTGRGSCRRLPAQRRLCSTATMIIPI